MVVCVFFLVISSAIRRLSFCLSRISSSVGTPDAKVRFSASYCCCSLSGKPCTARLCFSTSRSCWACSQASKTLSLGIPEPNNSLSLARHFWFSTGIERSACRCCASLNLSAISIYFCSSSSVGREDLKRSDNILSRSNSSGSIWAVTFAETSPSSLQFWSQWSISDTTLSLSANHCCSLSTISLSALLNFNACRRCLSCWITLRFSRCVLISSGVGYPAG